MKRMIISMIFVSLILLPALSAATDVGGLIDTDTTWNLAGSPYIVTGNTLVASGVRLTIEPGVQVRFNGKYSLIIDGNIQAKGSFNNEILFTSNLTPQQRNDWVGISIYNSPGSELSWAIVEYTSEMIFVGGTGTKINNCIFRYSQGLFLVGADLMVNNNHIHDSTIGVYILNFDTIYFMNNTLENIDGLVIGIDMYSHPVINHNNFLIPGYIVILYPQTDGLIDARYNYWGPATTSEMNLKGAAANIEKIYDFYDDPTRGKVEYDNWLNAPNPQAYPNPNAVPKFLPVANAGLDKVVFDTAILDGSASYDPDGQVDLYEWTLKHRETLAYNRTASGITPTVSALNSGFYDVTLTVTDNDGLVDTDTMLLAAAGRPVDPICPDRDGDGIPDPTDRCPGTPAGVAVDQAGCSLLQFCSSINVTTTERLICEKSDWKNDEPLRILGDCKVVRQGSIYKCVPR